MFILSILFVQLIINWWTCRTSNREGTPTPHDWLQKSKQRMRRLQIRIQGSQASSSMMWGRCRACDIVLTRRSLLVTGVLTTLQNILVQQRLLKQFRLACLCQLTIVQLCRREDDKYLADEVTGFPHGLNPHHPVWWRLSSFCTSC